MPRNRHYCHRKMSSLNYAFLFNSMSVELHAHLNIATAVLKSPEKYPRIILLLTVLYKLPYLQLQVDAAFL